jgi:hypothetical protein
MDITVVTNGWQPLSPIATAHLKMMPTSVEGSGFAVQGKDPMTLSTWLIECRRGNRVPAVVGGPTALLMETTEPTGGAGVARTHTGTILHGGK